MCQKLSIQAAESARLVFLFIALPEDPSGITGWKSYIEGGVGRFNGE